MAVTEWLDLDAWEAEARPVAYRLGIRPAEFEALTPADLDALVKADGEVFERWRDLAAWVTAHVMTATGNYGKDGVQWWRLVGKPSPMPAMPESSEVTVAAKDRMAQALALGGGKRKKAMGVRKTKAQLDAEAAERAKKVRAYEADVARKKAARGERP